MISIQIVFENQYWEKLRNEYAGLLYQDREQKLVFEDNSSFSNVSNSSQIINNDEDEFQFDNTKMNQLLGKQKNQEVEKQFENWSNFEFEKDDEFENVEAEQEPQEEE